MQIPDIDIMSEQQGDHPIGHFLYVETANAGIEFSSNLTRSRAGSCGGLGCRWRCEAAPWAKNGCREAAGQKKARSDLAEWAEESGSGRLVATPATPVRNATASTGCSTAATTSTSARAATSTATSAITAAAGTVRC